MSGIHDALVRGFQARQRDLPEEAIEHFLEAAKQSEDDDAIRLEVARSYLDLARPSEARSVLSRVDVDPSRSDDDAEQALELARLWMRAGDPASALDLYRSIPRGPGYLQAMLESVLLLERTHQLDAARAFAQSHPGLRGKHRNVPAALLALAVLDERDGDTVTAIARLERAQREAVPSPMTLECGYRLARLYDQHGEPEQAMNTLMHCKAYERRQMPGEVLEKHIIARRASDRAVLRELPQDWFDTRPKVHGSSRVVVLGHPRSGTSLLSSQLAKAGKAAWIDECPAFSVLARRVASQLHEANQSYAQYLQSIESRAIDPFEAEYCERLLDHLPKSMNSREHRLIDKNPGLSNSLPALHRMLPGSAWVYLERDPRDIAVSCFFQRFGSTPLGWACQSLRGALEAVLHTAALWIQVRHRLTPEQAVRVRYENVCSEPHHVIGQIVDTLGWGRDVQKVSSPDDTNAIQEPSVVHSPTYAEVRRPVHTRAVARWHRHRDALGPLTDEQRDIIEQLGYSA